MRYILGGFPALFFEQQTKILFTEGFFLWFKSTMFNLKNIQIEVLRNNDVNYNETKIAPKKTLNDKKS